jgi:flagellar basal-body rod modification protein FlgD
MTIEPVSLAAQSGLLGVGATGTPATSGTGAASAGTQLKRPGDTSDAFGLGRDDFFKLFLAQLKNQDPTKPVDDKEFIAQLAQFTMIDTLKSLDKAMAGTQLAQASGLIGKHVEGKAIDGTSVSGVVEKLIQDADGIALVVNGKSVQPADVSVVTPPDIATTGAAATPTNQAGSTSSTGA